MKPNLFIIGPPKTGTSALHFLIGQHPEVYVPPSKEIHYFATDLHRESDRLHGTRVGFLVRTRKEYLDLFKEGRGKKVWGDISPTYIYSRAAAKNIKRFNPKAKIIAIIRDPVELMYSWYTENRRQENETAKTFQEALDLEGERIRGKKIPKTAFTPSALFYRDIASYEKNLNRYFKEFKKKQILILVYEDFKRDNLKTYRKICRFLDIDDRFTPEVRIVRPNRNVRFPILNKIFCSMKLIPGKQYIPKWAKRSFVGWFRKITLVEGKRASLDPKIRTRLRQEYGPMVTRLGKLIGRNLHKIFGY